jgi:hypothetical protein
VLVMVPSFIAALDALRIEAISGPATLVLTRILEAVPNLIAASVFLLLTSFVASSAILGVVIAMGLRAMGIANEIVQLAFALGFGAVEVAVALSFGLGGREAAGKLKEHYVQRWLGP